MSKRAVLWDLDGTLTDPFVGITRSLQFAITELGYDAPDAEYLRQFIGPPLQVTFSALLGSDDPALADEALRLYRQRYAETGKFENELIPGIAEALKQAQATADEMFLATSKLETYSIEIVEHFGLRGFFKTVHGSQLDGSRADKGELIAHIIATEGLNPAQTIMIGDRKHDIIGAAKNNVRTIGVLWGFGDRTELSDAGAAAIVDQPAQLPDLIQALYDKAWLQFH